MLREERRAHSLRSLAFVSSAAVDDTAEGATPRPLPGIPPLACVIPGNQTTLLFGLGRKREFDRFKISNLRAPSIAVPDAAETLKQLLATPSQQIFQLVFPERFTIAGLDLEIKKLIPQANALFKEERDRLV